MTLFLIAIIVIAALGLLGKQLLDGLERMRADVVGALQVARADRPGGLERRVKRTIVIFTRDGHSVRGILLESYADCLVLAHPVWLQGMRPANLGGQFIVPLDNVMYAQDVTGVVELGDTQLQAA